MVGGNYLVLNHVWFISYHLQFNNGQGHLKFMAIGVHKCGEDSKKERSAHNPQCISIIEHWDGEGEPERTAEVESGVSDFGIGIKILPQCGYANRCFNIMNDIIINK